MVRECVSPKVFDALASSRMAIEKFRNNKGLGSGTVSKKNKQIKNER